MAGYIYKGNNEKIERLRAEAAGKRAEAAAIRQAIEEDRAASRELYRARKDAPKYKPTGSLAADVEATIQWVNTCLPDPKYGGETGLYAAAREVESYRGGGRSGALVAA